MAGMTFTDYGEFKESTNAFEEWLEQDGPEPIIEIMFEMLYCMGHVAKGTYIVGF